MAKKGDKWTPLREANHIVPLSEQDITEALLAFARAGREATREQVIADLEAEARLVSYFVNDIYQVARRDCGGMFHLNIRRRDGKPIFRDWRHFQRIKNELVGEECEGVELYPAESRLNDTANKYHLWVVKDRTYRFPFGMQERDVQEESGTRAGFKQRRFA